MSRSRSGAPGLRTFPSRVAGVAFLAAAVLAAGASPRAIAAVVVSGQVVDASSGAAVAGAWVAIGEVVDDDGDGVKAAAHAFSDASGGYSLVLPSSGDVWNVAVHAPGYVNLGRTVAEAVLTGAHTLALTPSAAGVAYWGRLTSIDVPGASLAAVAVRARDVGPDFVAITDETGRFGLTVAPGAEVGLRLLSGAFPVTIHDLAITSAGTPANPEPIEVRATVPRSPVTVVGTLASTGGPLPAGTAVRVFGVDPDTGEIVFDEERPADAAGMVTTDFGVADGTIVHVVGGGAAGWGHAVGVGPVGPGGLALVADDGGAATLSAELVLHDGLADGSLVVEAVVSDPTTGTTLAFPIATATFAGPTTASWTGLPAGTYRLRHRAGGLDRVVDEVTLDVGASGGGTYVLARPPTKTPNLGSGEGDVAGAFFVEGVAPAVQYGSTIDVVLFDPRTGRVVAEGEAAPDGSWSCADVPAGDWTLTAGGALPDGTAVQLLHGPLGVAVETGTTLTIPPLALHPAIGLLVTAYSVDADADEPLVAEIGEMKVRLYAGPQLIAERTTDDFHVAIGGVSPAVDRLEVQVTGHATRSIPLDLTAVDPTTHFDHYLVAMELN